MDWYHLILSFVGAMQKNELVGASRTHILILSNSHLVPNCLCSCDGPAIGFAIQKLQFQKLESTQELMKHAPPAIAVLEISVYWAWRIWYLYQALVKQLYRLKKFVPPKKYNLHKVIIFSCRMVLPVFLVKSLQLQQVLSWIHTVFGLIQ